MGQWWDVNEWEILNHSKKILSDSCYIHNTIHGKKLRP